jgi:hypothetical protein
MRLVQECLFGNHSGACTCVIQTYEGSKLRHLAVNACLFPLVGGNILSYLIKDGLTLSSCWKACHHH